MRNYSTRCYVIAGIAASSVFISCATNPAGPTRVRLEVRPPTSGLALGDTEDFTLFQINESVAARRDDATWSVDRPDIITVSASGHVASVAIGMATLTATAGGEAAQRSLRVVPNLAGTWIGELRVLDDTRMSGEGPFRPMPGLRAPLQFDLQQVHDVVSGTGVVLAPPPTGAVGPVSAQWESTSTIRLGGTFRTSEGFEAEFTNWQGDVATSGNSMTGRFTMTTRYSNLWGPQIVVKQCEIVTLARVVLAQAHEAARLIDPSA